MPNEYPNYYGVQHIIGNASTAPALIPFGFSAKYVRLHYLGGFTDLSWQTSTEAGVAVYANFQQSTQVSTGDAQLGVGDPMVVSGVSGISGVSLFTTSTGAPGIAINVLAME
jgi:hypothetical protein